MFLSSKLFKNVYSSFSFLNVGKLNVCSLIILKLFQGWFYRWIENRLFSGTFCGQKNPTDFKGSCWTLILPICIKWTRKQPIPFWVCESKVENTDESHRWNQPMFLNLWQLVFFFLLVWKCFKFVGVPPSDWKKFNWT